MSKSTREHELLTELRAARRELAAAQEAEDEARRVAAERKTIRRKVEMLIEEILDEVTTGKRRDSLIEYAESRADETADERQRGPTAADRPREVDETADLIGALGYALTPTPEAEDAWDEYRRLGGISDAQVMEVLRAVWPPHHRCTINIDGPDWTTIGGPQPVFWLGDQTGPRPKPLGLDGAELAAAVRRALDIPPWDAASIAAAGKPARKRPKRAPTAAE